VVFIGFTAWKIEANQAACITNLSGIEQAVHAHQNAAAQSGLPASIATKVFTSAWKEGADKGACVINLTSIQKAVRGYQNLKSLITGDPLTVDTLTNEGFWTSVPTCPAGGSYSFLRTVPAAGIAYATCRNPGHAPAQTALDDWSAGMPRKLNALRAGDSRRKTSSRSIAINYGPIPSLF
jgi:hypothetical protein